MHLGKGQELFEKLCPHYRGQPKLISVIKEARLQLREQMVKQLAGN